MKKKDAKNGAGMELVNIFTKRMKRMK